MTRPDPKPVTALMLIAALVIFTTLPARTEETGERDAILRAALDCGEDWCRAEGARMARALHPELAKRMVYTDRRERRRPHTQGALTLIRNTEKGGGSRSPLAGRQSTATILDIFDNTAMVRVDGPEWGDFLQIAKWDGLSFYAAARLT